MPDDCDIFSGDESDDNADGVPDTCQPNVWDLNEGGGCGVIQSDGPPTWLDLFEHNAGFLLLLLLLPYLQRISRNDTSRTGQALTR